MAGTIVLYKSNENPTPNAIEAINFAVNHLNTTPENVYTFTPEMSQRPPEQAHLYAEVITRFVDGVFKAICYSFEHHEKLAERLAHSDYTVILLGWKSSDGPVDSICRKFMGPNAVVNVEVREGSIIATRSDNDEIVEEPVSAKREHPVKPGTIILFADEDGPWQMVKRMVVDLKSCNLSRSMNDTNLVGKYLDDFYCGKYDTIVVPLWGVEKLGDLIDKRSYRIQIVTKSSYVDIYFFDRMTSFLVPAHFHYSRSTSIYEDVAVTTYTFVGETPLPVSAIEVEPEPMVVAPAVDPAYKALHDVLERAYNDAANGKGKERHAQALPFEDQPMQRISRLIGSPDGMAFQAMKKIQESLRRPTTETKVRELLGAINYIAGMVIYIESQEQ